MEVSGGRKGGGENIEGNIEPSHHLADDYFLFLSVNKVIEFQSGSYLKNVLPCSHTQDSSLSTLSLTSGIQITA